MEAAEVNNLVEGKVRECMKENNAELLQHIGTMITQISAPTPPTLNTLNEIPNFKRKSNQEQFKVNSKVLAKIEEAEGKLNNAQAASQTLIEAKDLIKRRQKLIQLADTSELGWRLVAEYETNPIASDSDDEKRIYKAEARASRKMKADKAKKKNTRTAPYNRPRTETSTTAQSGSGYVNQQQRPGVCFICNKPGHWKRECLQRDRSNNKISRTFDIKVQTESTESEYKTVDAGKEIEQGIGLTESIKRKIDEAGIPVNDEKAVIKRMATHILSSRAEGTVSKYYYQVRIFKDFCEKNDFPFSPATPIHVAMYLSNMIDSGKSNNVITSAYYAIKWLHSVNGLTDPTENSFVKNILESAKRLNSKPIVKKEVISSEHLVELCEKFSHSSDVITNRDLCMILLSYAGFLRFSEVSDLRCCDITFKTDHLVLKIRKSKTDIYRSGKEVLIAKGFSSACPYNMLRKYLDCAGLDVGSEHYLFQPACRSGSRCFLLNKDKKLSYTRARECIVQKLKLVAPNLRLGTHSLRASGATVAANAEGVSDRCLKRHGRWRSESAKDGYIEDSVEKKLFITKQLKL